MHMTRIHNHFEIITEEGATEVLGTPRSVPLSPQAMAQSLRVTFFPIVSASEQVRRFAQHLRKALALSGVSVLEYEDALDSARPGKIREGIVIVAPGELQSGNLPVDHVSNLRTSTVVGIVDGPCPADVESRMQEKLNSVVQALAWSIVQVVIFVDSSAWTICTMNGAIIRCESAGSFETHVRTTLIPKLAAPVVPPHATDFEVHEGGLDLASDEYAPYVTDFIEGGPLWAETGLMLFHTSLESLRFRNRYYQRVAAAYLDNRSGMSYGFLARQLACPVQPALTPAEAQKAFGGADWDGEEIHRIGERIFVSLRVADERLVAEVPDVWVLTTRSGCNKSRIDPHRDLVLLGLARGKVVFKTPRGVSTRIDCRPSYDTKTILSHAVGNAIVAGLLQKFIPAPPFSLRLIRHGMALAHWHGYLRPSMLPDGYLIHGDTNPPVSCSTHQAALFALTGKLTAMKRSLERKIDFRGDIHNEPHHGTNITGPSLVELGRWALQHIEQLTGEGEGTSEPEEVKVSSMR